MMIFRWQSTKHDISELRFFRRLCMWAISEAWNRHPSLLYCIQSSVWSRTECIYTMLCTADAQCVLGVRSATQMRSPSLCNADATTWDFSSATQMLAANSAQQMFSVVWDKDVWTWISGSAANIGDTKNSNGVMKYHSDYRTMGWCYFHDALKAWTANGYRQYIYPYSKVALYMNLSHSWLSTLLSRYFSDSVLYICT